MAKQASNKSKSLVIVESPAKARTIGKYLGSDYTVEASIGHVRDLPKGAKEVPEQFKREEWAYLGVNVNDRFKPIYIVPLRQETTSGEAAGRVKAIASSLPRHGRRS